MLKEISSLATGKLSQDTDLPIMIIMIFQILIIPLEIVIPSNQG